MKSMNAMNNFINQIVGFIAIAYAIFLIKKGEMNFYIKGTNEKLFSLKGNTAKILCVIILAIGLMIFFEFIELDPSR